MYDQRANSDLLVAWIAARQHGVVSIAQLRSAGLDKHRVRHRVRSGRLHRVHRAVYAVGHRALSQEGRWMAAVLASGDGAVLSHRSAASLWGLLDPRDGPVDVSIPSASGRRRRTGIRLHRCQSLSPQLTSRRRGIPVTTPARTIADLKREVSAPQLRRAIRQAEVLGLRTGVSAPSERTCSELEHLFLALCRRGGLPMPQVNVRLGSRVVDFLWREQQVVVETDGYRYHRGALAFEDDHERDLELRLLGYEVVRVSYRQVTETPNRVVAAVRQALGNV